MWSNYLKMLISSGLLLSFLLVSCSEDTSQSVDAGNGPTDGSDLGATGNGATSASGSVSATTTGGATSGGTAGPPVASPAPPEHWISSVSFQKIEAGSFTMGSPADEPNRQSSEDQVEVTISKPFAIMTTEVTQSQWVQVMENNPSMFKTDGDCDDHDSEKDMCPNNPVEQVSWNDVQEYIKKLNDSLELTGCGGTPRSSTGCYRLPTEAEWEYAARGGTNTAYSFGDSSDLGDYAWYHGNSDEKTHPVGEKTANPYNLYDVHGNVWEWVQDRYTYIFPGGDDPLQTFGSYRVIRGGSWGDSARYLRSAERININPAYRSNDLGFRLVRTLNIIYPFNL